MIHRKWFQEKDQLFSLSNVFGQLFFALHKLFIGLWYSIYSMIIYGANISAIINKSVKDV